MQDSPKIQSPNICHYVGGFDLFGRNEVQIEVIRQISRLIDTFFPIQKFRISAEELSQLFCRIRRKFKVLIFDIYWVDLICLGILKFNLE